MTGRRTQLLAAVRRIRRHAGGALSAKTTPRRGSRAVPAPPLPSAGPKR